MESEEFGVISPIRGLLHGGWETQSEQGRFQPVQVHILLRGARQVQQRAP